MDEITDDMARELEAEADRAFGDAPSDDRWYSSSLVRHDLLEVLRALPDGAGPEAVRARVYAAEVERGIAGHPADGTGTEALLIVHGLHWERDYAAVTAQLALEPTVRRRDAWVFGTRSMVAGADPAAHFTALLELLRPRLDALRELSRGRDVEVAVRVVEGLPWRHARYREFLGAVRSLRAGLDFEMY